MNNHTPDQRVRVTFEILWRALPFRFSERGQHPSRWRWWLTIVLAVLGIAATVLLGL